MSLIRAKTAHLARLYPCRAFYDTIGDTLSVGIKQKGKFKYTLDGEACSFDLTRDGKLLNIDIWAPRREWKLERAIHPPEEYSTQNVLVQAEGGELEVVELLTDETRGILNVRLARERVSHFVSPATSLIFELNGSNEILGFWLIGIVDDINFQKEGEWRRSIKAV